MKVKELLDKIEMMIKTGDLESDSEIVFALFTSFGAVESELTSVVSRPSVNYFSEKNKEARALSFQRSDSFIMG